MADLHKILITGGSGWIGRAIAARLAGPDVRIICLSRHPGEGPWDETIALDLADAFEVDDELKRKVGAADTWIHAAGTPPGKVSKAAMARGNVAATAGMLRLAGAVNAPRILHLSTAEVYHQRSLAHRPAQEHDTPRPHTAFGKSKVRAEELVRKSGIPALTLRLATVFGAGDRRNMLPLARSLARRAIIIPGNGRARKSLLPITMLAEVVSELVGKDWSRFDTDVLNVALPSSPPLRSVCDAFARECGFHRPWRCPVPVLRTIGLIGDALAAFRVPVFPNNRAINELVRETPISASRLCDLLPEFEWSNFSSHLRDARDYYRKAGRSKT